MECGERSTDESIIDCRIRTIILDTQDWCHCGNVMDRTNKIVQARSPDIV